MATLHTLGCRELDVKREANQIGSHFLESIIESRLVVLSLTFAVADETITISNKNQDSAVVNSIEGSHIGYTI